MIFGATGDLAHRKLLPALYNLAHEGQLPERFEMIGVGRRDKEHEEFRDTLIDSVRRYSRRRPDERVLGGLIDDTRYVQGSFDDDSIYEELGADAGGVRRAGRPDAEPRLLPVDRARVLPADRRASSARPGSTRSRAPRRGS